MELRFILNSTDWRLLVLRSDTQYYCRLSQSKPFLTMTEVQQRASRSAPKGVASRSERTLSQLHAGTRGKVARVLGEASDALRLKALGLCEGREVRVLRTGDAWVVRVLGSRIGLSESLAAKVIVIAA